MIYNPFARGPFPVGVRTLVAHDRARDQRPLTTEVWYPASESYAGQDLADASQDAFTVCPGLPSLRQAAVRDAAPYANVYPFLVFSHASWSHRLQSTFLMTHLASHGYIVAAVDHSGNTMIDRAARQAEANRPSPIQQADRLQTLMTHRVLDIQFVLHYVLSGSAQDLIGQVDPTCLGVVGHSIGGWTALAATAADGRIRSTIAMAPAVSSQPRPGIIPVEAPLEWERDVPILVLGAKRDTLIPLSDLDEWVAKAQTTTSMVVLQQADHFHFCDHVEQAHERARTLARSAESSWMSDAFPPMSTLCTGDRAHLVIRSLGLAHLDATLNANEAAQLFLSSDLEARFQAHGAAIQVRLKNFG